MLMLLRILRRSHFLAKHHSKNNGATEQGLWADLSHFLLPWDKQQLESSSTAQYLEQTIPSDCINCSEIRLDESTQR